MEVREIDSFSAIYLELKTAHDIATHHIRPCMCLLAQPFCEWRNSCLQAESDDEDGKQPATAGGGTGAAAGGRASPAAQPAAAEAIPPELVNMQTTAQPERLRDDAHPAALQHGTTEQPPPPPPREQVPSSCRAYVFRVHQCGLCFTSCVLEGVLSWCSDCPSCE